MDPGWLVERLKKVDIFWIKIHLNSFVFDVMLQMSILQLLLKQKVAVLGAALRLDDPWLWRLRRLLLLSLQYVCAASSKDSIAAPLRVVEVFTSMENVQQALGDQLAVQHLCNTYAYLVNKGMI